MSAFRNIVARRRPSLIRPEIATEEPAASGPATVGPEQPSDAPLVLLDPVDTSPPPVPAGPAPHPATAGEAPQRARRPATRLVGEGFLPDTVPPETIAESGEGAPEASLGEPGATAPESKIWDLEPAAAAPGVPDARYRSEDDASLSDLTERVARAAAPDGATAPAPVPAPCGPGAPAPLTQSRRGRTRLLGFHAEDLVPDPFASGQKAVAAAAVRCPVGFLAIVDGPGFGTSFALAAGLSTLGRGEDQTVTLDFGDDSISRNNHAAIAYDDEENQVLIGHGGKSNLVRLNGKPLVSTTELSQGDQIRIGKTTLRYVALCGPEFCWPETRAEAAGNV